MITVVAALLLTACTAVDSPPIPLPSASTSGLTLNNLISSQNINVSEPLSLNGLAAIAVFTNPDLKVLRASLGVADSQVFAAGLFPDPTFSLGFDVPLNGTGLVTALSVGLGIDFNALAHRPSALRAARANYEKVYYDIAWAEWLTGEQARLLGARVFHLRGIKALTTQLRYYTDNELAQSLLAVSHGDLSPTSLEARRLAATDAADRDRSAELQLRDAELKLNRLLGIDPAETLFVAALNHPLQTLPSVQALFVNAEDARVDLAAIRANYLVALATIDAAQLGAYPLPALGINMARDTGKLKTLGPSISFALPLWNRGRGDIAVAQANQAQLRAEYSARLEQVRADIAAAWTALDISRKQRADIRHEITPLISQADATDRAAERGDLSLSIAYSSRMTLLDKQIVEATLALAVSEFEIALEISTGQPLEAIR